MLKIIMSFVLVMLTAGCVFADTAKLGVLVLDEATGKPVAGVKVRGGFRVRARGLAAVKGAPLPNVCFSVTDRDGRCKVEGETNCGHAGAAVEEVPQGYYCPLYGEGHWFTNKNLFGVWKPDNLVVTLRVQRVENPIPLFVKKIGQYYGAEDLFSKTDGILRFDFVTGDWLPPIGNGKVADVEFERLPREDLGEGVNGGGDKGRSYRDSMLVRFQGSDNGLVEMETQRNARLKIRTSPDEGFVSEVKCWHGKGKDLQLEESYDKDRCYCFRIRTRRNEKGEIVKAYYGKIYGDIKLLSKGTPYVPVASLRFTYYLNPNNLDRNLEWNKQNLCADPIYPIPQRSRRMEYESFNREQMP